MSRRCQTCGKKAQTGNSISRRGLPKKSGGIGLKTTGIHRRKFFPNLQTKRILVEGKVTKVLMCAKCIKKGAFTPASRKLSLTQN